MEGFSSFDAAYIQETTPDLIDKLVAEALLELEQQLHTDVLIVEDKPIIAFDLESIVRDLGHNVVGVVTNRLKAVRKDREDRPGLILVDLHLRDEFTGVQAASEILANRKLPIIFITAFPERVLTGERVEPAFLITKPFQRSTVKAMIAQVLYFSDEGEASQFAPTNSPSNTELLRKGRDGREATPAQLEARAGPIDAEVVAGRIELKTNINP